MAGERPAPRTIEQVYLAAILEALERIEAQVARLIEPPKPAPKRRTRKQEGTADGVHV
jgi:hypothetical protein